MSLGMILLLAAAGVLLTAGWRYRRRRRPCARRIVVFAPGTADREADRIVRSMHGRIVKRLPLINGAVCELAEPDAVTLSAHERVTRVDDDLQVHAYCRFLDRLFWKPQPPVAQPQPPEAIPWGVERIGAPAAWNEAGAGQGAGVDVAVLDTGVDLGHPDLSPNLAAGVNVLSPRRPPADDNGHGTHVSGIIAAAQNSLGVVGVAPRVRIHPVKVLDRNGGGTLSDIVEGLDWCVRNGIRVANLSLGSPEGNATFAQAVARAIDEGVVVVAAAGNNGPFPDTIGYPARYPEVVAVGATTQKDQVAEFSSRGEGLDVVAPGDAILSTWPQGSYREVSGTSMACPHVAGLAALLLAANPGLTPQQVAERLKGTAVPLAGFAPEEQGAGLVDAGRALARTYLPDREPDVYAASAPDASAKDAPVTGPGTEAGPE